MGSAVQSSPLTSTLTMRAFLTVFLASLTLLSTTLWLDIPTPSSTERGRLRLSPSLTLSDRSLPDIILLTLLLREDFTMGESLLTLPCTLSLPLSTTVWLDTPDIIPMSTARGRLRPSPSTDTDTPLTHTTVLSDIPDIIPMSTARGRLRPQPPSCRRHRDDIRNIRQHRGGQHRGVRKGRIRIRRRARPQPPSCRRHRDDIRSIQPHRGGQRERQGARQR